jgi:hypothetical protein
MATTPVSPAQTTAHSTDRPSGPRRSRRWRRRLAAVLAGAGLVALTGCYGPIVDDEITMQFACEVFVNEMLYDEEIRTFNVTTELPEWTDPGGGTPFHVEIAPAEPEEGESGPYLVTLSGEGVVGDLTNFVSGTTPQGIVVTAEPGGEVVLRVDSIYRSEEVAGPSPYRISRSCNPYVSELPEIGRIPVREAS